MHGAELGLLDISFVVTDLICQIAQFALRINATTCSVVQHITCQNALLRFGMYVCMCVCLCVWYGVCVCSYLPFPMTLLLHNIGHMSCTGF